MICIYLMKHVVFLQDSTCSITIVIYIWNKYCVIGSVVTHRPTVAKDASSRLAQNKGHFVLPKNCPQCMCTYIYNRCTLCKYVHWHLIKEKILSKFSMRNRSLLTMFLTQKFSTVFNFFLIKLKNTQRQFCKALFTTWKTNNIIYYKCCKRIERYINTRDFEGSF